MGTEKQKELLKKLFGYRYMLLVLVLGMLLLLWPPSNKPGRTGGGGVSESGGAGIGEIVRLINGAGEAEVLVSENGAVVVCEGAGSAEVRLCITRAVSAYTGLSSDKIAVIKMK